MSEQSKKEPRDYWGESGQVFYTAGKGYALTPALQTICIGNEEDVLKEKGDDNDGIGETDLVGTGDDGTPGRNEKTTKQSTPRQRLALRSSKQNSKNLLRR